MAMDTLTQNIKSRIYSSNNDYGANKKTAFKINGCSIIIPVYNQWEELLYCIKSLFRQTTPKPLEIIIVDDCSFRLTNLDRITKLNNKKFRINIFRLKKNIGAAASRNIGVSRSKYNLLIFLDSDMIVPKNFILEYIKIHKNFCKIVSVGFRKDTQFDLRDRKIMANIYRIPSHKSDFRYKKFVPSEWKKFFPDINSNVFGKYYYVLKETDNFRKFNGDKTIGVWDLPSMVVGSSMAINYNDFVSVGGFDDRFKGCWYEDTHLGAKLIAGGIKIIPVKNVTSYHLVRIKNNNLKKNHIIKINRELYFKLIKEELTQNNKSKFINNINKKYESIITKIA